MRAQKVQFDGDWPALAQKLNVGGIAQQLARQSELKRFEGSMVELTVLPTEKHLTEKAYQEKLQTALTEYFGAPIRLSVTVGAAVGGVVPAKIDTAQERAVVAINQDGFVRELQEQLGATIVDTSINPEQKRSEA